MISLQTESEYLQNVSSLMITYYTICMDPRGAGRWALITIPQTHNMSYGTAPATWTTHQASIDGVPKYYLD